MIEFYALHTYQIYFHSYEGLAFKTIMIFTFLDLIGY